MKDADVNTGAMGCTWGRPRGNWHWALIGDRRHSGSFAHRCCVGYKYWQVRMEEWENFPTCNIVQYEYFMDGGTCLLHYERHISSVDVVITKASDTDLYQGNSMPFFVCNK